MCAETPALTQKSKASPTAPSVGDLLDVLSCALPSLKMLHSEMTATSPPHLSTATASAFVLPASVPAHPQSPELRSQPSPSTPVRDDNLHVPLSAQAWSLPRPDCGSTQQCLASCL